MITLYKPKINDFNLFCQRCQNIFESGIITNQGPFVRQLENSISNYLGINGLVIANGTLALILALAGLNLKGKVIMPSFTFCATSHALKWVGLEPQFVDINLETFNIDPKKVEEAITPETSA